MYQLVRALCANNRQFLLDSCHRGLKNTQIFAIKLLPEVQTDFQVSSVGTIGLPVKSKHS